MRKLVIGIVAAALLALIAVPAMAFEVEENVTVEIIVESYGAINFSPDPTLSFHVLGPLEDPVVAYGGSLQFNVLCNTNCTLKLTVDKVTKALFDPGKGFWYPTATGKSDDAINHFIGYGVALRKISDAFVAWPSYSTEAGAIAGGKGPSISFTLIEANTTADNAEIKVNSYMDSAKYGDVLAPKGTYEGILTLTLSAS